MAAEPARRLHSVAGDAFGEESPSLDPAAIERAYIRERARRHARAVRHHDAVNSSARFWVVLAALMLLTVVITLFAWHQVQATFGI